jgi:hypothetical protein
MKEPGISKSIAPSPGLQRLAPCYQSPLFQFLAIEFARPFVLLSLPSQTQIAQLLPDSFFQELPLTAIRPEKSLIIFTRYSSF